MTLRLGDKLIADITDEHGGGSNVVVDDVTIIKDENDTISAQAVLDSNSSTLQGVKTWTGTLKEYNAISEKDDKTLYYITDDADAGEYIANTDLSNLTDLGQSKFDEKANKTDVLNKSQITNCLLEVPQNIKLELNDGTLTLKAGSKVIVPNGANNFDEIITTQDYLVSTTANTTCTVYYSITYNKIEAFSGQNSSSDADIETAGKVHYNTTANKITRKSQDGAFQQLSFPIAKIVLSGSTVTEIKEVFQGMGYIGSTIWVDKGVKGLAPNSRNEDGSLNNEEWITTNVITRTFIQSISNCVIALNPNEPIEGYLFGAISMNAFYYNPEENRNYNTGVNEEWRFTPIALNATLTSGVISNFNPKLPFRAVDYNDYTKDLDTKADKTDLDTKADKTDLNAKVNKAGDTMTGGLRIKTTVNPALNYHCEKFDLTTNPASTVSAGFTISDKAGTRIGMLECQQMANGSKHTGINTMYTKGDGTKTYVAIQVGYDVNGNAYTSAPTPSTGDNSTKIATTAFCANRRCTSKATTTSSASVARPAWIVQNYLNGTSWYRVWSDGWIEQGGTVSRNANDITITLLKNMSNTNYTILRSEVGQTRAQYDSVIHTITTSSFKVYCAMTTSEKTAIKWYACGY